MRIREYVDRKEHILQAAAQLFSQKGFQASSMRELADRVGIEAASIYSHFAAKDDLLRTIAFRCADEFLHGMQPIYASDRDPAAKLAAMLRMHLETILRNQQQSVVFLNEWRHLEPQARAEFSAMRDTYEDMFREVIRQGVASGQFRHVDEKFGMLTLLSALNWTSHWYRPDGPLGPEALAAQLTEILMQGMVQHRA